MTRFAAVLGLLLCVPSAAATRAEAYEERVIAWGLEQAGLERLPPTASPEGRRIDEVHVALQDIVSEDDPYPQIANAPHVRTREDIVRRELLFVPGDEWTTAKIEETERILATLGLFSIVRIVPAKGNAPDTVKVLVVTKDIWSLRLNTDWNLVGDLLQFFQFRPTETNLFGRGKRLTLGFLLTLDQFSVGVGYVDPRVWGSKLSLAPNVSVVFNRETKEAEGSSGSLSFGRPLRNLEEKWGWSVGGDWNITPVRVYRGADIELLQAPDGTAVPVIYDAQLFTASATVTRSFGYTYKTTWSGGVGAYNGEYTVPVSLGLSEENRAFLQETRLPLSENARYLATKVRSFLAEYRTFRELSTFALSERIQVGHSLVSEVRWAPGVLGSVPFASGLASARYRWALGNSITGITATASARYWTDEADAAASGTRWVNRRWAAELFEATPPVGPGRFIFRGLVDMKSFDLSPVPLYLGGGNGLRGVVPEVFAGDRRVLFNVEYRTRPLEFRTVHLGGVLFYDAGSAFDEAPDWAHTVGLGLRFLLPQFDVSPLRIDFGYAIRGPRAQGADGISSAFGQVTEYASSYVAGPHD